MSLLFRGQERRDFGAVPAIPSNGEQRRFSIRSVDLSTTDAAMQKVAVAAAVNLLASMLESLPLHVYSGFGQDKRRRPTPTWLADLGGDGHGTEDWLFQGLYSMSLRGNLVGIVAARDETAGKPRQIVLANPDDVRLDKRDGVKWFIKGKEVPPEELFHRRAFPRPGAILGSSSIGQHALTVGGSIASEQYAAQFYLDGGHPTALFKNTSRTIDEQAAQGIKSRYLSMLRGKREPLVVGSDWTYEVLQVSQQDAQYLQTLGYSSTECARIFGPGVPEILGYETGGSMTYTNIEQRSLDFLRFALDPWLKRFERILSSLLPAPQYVQFERKAFLETDIMTRFRAHEIGIRNNFETVNEVRTVEDMSPVPWGDSPSTNHAPAPIPVQVEGP